MIKIPIRNGYRQPSIPILIDPRGQFLLDADMPMPSCRYSELPSISIYMYFYYAELPMRNCRYAELPIFPISILFSAYRQIGISAAKLGNQVRQFGKSYLLGG